VKEVLELQIMQVSTGGGIGLCLKNVLMNQPGSLPEQEEIVALTTSIESKKQEYVGAQEKARRGNRVSQPPSDTQVLRNGSDVSRARMTGSGSSLATYSAGAVGGRAAVERGEDQPQAATDPPREEHQAPQGGGTSVHAQSLFAIGVLKYLPFNVIWMQLAHTGDVTVPACTVGEAEAAVLMFGKDAETLKSDIHRKLLDIHGGRFILMPC
jgi:hypothetical protein